MISASPLPDPEILSQLVAAEESRVRSLDTTQSLALISLPLHLGQFDILRWLRSSTECPRSYWSSRDRSLEYGGIGNVLQQQHWQRATFPERLDELQQLLRGCSLSRQIRAFVGCRFDPDSVNDEIWRDFPHQSIQLPELSVINHAGEFTAFITTLVGPNHDRDSLMSRVLELAQHLQSCHDIGENNYSLMRRCDLPNQSGWKQAVQTAISAIESQQVEKIVLARRTDFLPDRAINALDLLVELSRNAANCYQVMYSPTNESTLVCLSPEQLFSCDGLRLSTEAVAGTIRRGESDIEDLTFENRLRNSAKDQTEQRIVQDGIAASLAPLCDEIEVSTAATVMKLAHVQHLKSEFRAILRPTTTLGSIFQALHPTAAVCGMPRTEALRMLVELEHFDRGWYASGIGVVGSESCEFAVGIRSVLFHPRALSIFTGAGIVSQSDYNTEWQELEDKLQSIIPSEVGTDD